MAKTHRGTPKKQGGISLIPELWDAIELAARRARVSKNQVMETALMREFGFADDFQKSYENGRKVESDLRPVGLEDEE